MTYNCCTASGIQRYEMFVDIMLTALEILKCISTRCDVCGSWSGVELSVCCDYWSHMLEWLGLLIMTIEALINDLVLLFLTFEVVLIDPDTTFITIEDVLNCWVQFLWLLKSCVRMTHCNLSRVGNLLLKLLCGSINRLTSWWHLPCRW